MSLFSNQLQIAMEDLGMTQTALSEHTGISTSQLSKYSRGVYRPSPEVLEQICLSFPEPQRAEIAAAHARDEVPPSAKSLVTVTTDPNRTQDAPGVYGRPRLRRELREAFAFLEGKVLQSEKWADWILNTHDAMRE